MKTVNEIITDTRLMNFREIGEYLDKFCDDELEAYQKEHNRRSWGAVAGALQSKLTELICEYHSLEHAYYVLEQANEQLTAHATNTKRVEG